MKLREARKMATYYSKLYKSTGDQIYRECVSYLRGILLKNKTSRALRTTILTATTSIILSSCAGNFHLHNSVIEQTDCYNNSKDTIYYASVPYINHNYVYKVKVNYDLVTYEEIEKKKMWTNWQAPVGISIHLALWLGLIFMTF